MKVQRLKEKNMHCAFSMSKASGFSEGIHTWDACHTWWGGIHPQAASLTTAQRWAVFALPARKWHRTESNTSSRPPPGCERSPQAPRFQDSPASCLSICSNMKPWKEARITALWFMPLWTSQVAVNIHDCPDSYVRQRLGMNIIKVNKCILGKIEVSTVMTSCL